MQLPIPRTGKKAPIPATRTGFVELRHAVHLGEDVRHIRVDHVETTRSPTIPRVEAHSDLPHVESGVPYTVNMGVGTSQWGPWFPSLGPHVVRVTPYTGSARKGQPGETKTLAFVVTN